MNSTTKRTTAEGSNQNILNETSAVKIIMAVIPHLSVRVLREGQGRGAAHP